MDSPADLLTKALPSAMLRPQVHSEPLPDTEKNDAMPATMSFALHRDAEKPPPWEKSIHQSCPPPELPTRMEKIPVAPLDQHSTQVYGDVPPSLHRPFSVFATLHHARKFIFRQLPIGISQYLRRLSPRGNLIRGMWISQTITDRRCPKRASSRKRGKTRYPCYRLNSRRANITRTLRDE